MVAVRVAAVLAFAATKPQVPQENFLPARLKPSPCKSASRRTLSMISAEDVMIL